MTFVTITATSMERHHLLKTRLFDVERVAYETPSTGSIVRDIIRHPGSVAIVPVLGDGSICLIKNYRVSVDDTLVEIPAGTLETGETPLACATRELTEETGYRAGKMEKLASFYPAPGILDELMHLFLATELTAGDPAREPGEQIENHVVSPAEARRLVADGTIRDAKTIVGLLMVTNK